MLQFAVAGSSWEAQASGEDDAVASLDRAGLRAAYEAALRVQAEGSHAEAAEKLGTLLRTLSEHLAGGEEVTRSDQTWLQQVQRLCFKNQASSLRRLQQTAEALECYRGAICSGDNEVSTWQAVAECASQTGDWHAVRMGFEQVLQAWPGNIVALRGLARSLLQLGDLGACEKVLGLLSEAAAANAGGAAGEAHAAQPLHDKEQWLLARLRARLQPRPRPPQDSEGSAKRSAEDGKGMAVDYEASYAALSQERAKRLRAAALPRAIGAERVQLSNLSLAELLGAARSAASRWMPPFQAVSFEWRPGAALASKEIEVEVKDVPLAPRGSRLARGRVTASEVASGYHDIEQAVDEVWAALEPLTANGFELKRQPGQSRDAWAKAMLDKTSALSSVPAEMGVERAESSQKLGDAAELAAVAGVLEVDKEWDESKGDVVRVSPERPWCIWLIAVLSFILDGRELVERCRGRHRILQWTVELAVSLMLLATPGQRADSLAGGSVGLGVSWTSSAFLLWLQQPDEEGEEEGGDVPMSQGSIRSQVKKFLQCHGERLAELCSTPRIHPSSALLRFAGLEFLRASSVARGLPVTAADWLRSPFDPEGQESNASLVTALIGDSPDSSAEGARFFWSASALLPPTDAASALRWCQLCIDRQGITVDGFGSGGSSDSLKTSEANTVSTAACAAQLRELQLQLQQKQQQRRRQMKLDKPIDLADEAEGKDVFQAKSPAEEVAELARQIVSMRIPPLSIPLPKTDESTMGEFLRVAREFSQSFGKEDAKAITSARIALVFEAFAFLFRSYLCGLQKLGWVCSSIHPHQDAVLVFVISVAADLVEAFSRHAAGIQELETMRRVPTTGTYPNSLFRGLAVDRQGDSGPEMISLIPPIERLALDSLLLVTQLATHVGCRDWLPVGHGALCLAAKIVGTLLLGAGGTTSCPAGSIRGGLLLLRRSAIPSPASGGVAAVAPAPIAASFSSEDSFGAHTSAAEALTTMTPREFWICLCRWFHRAHDLGLALPVLFRRLPSIGKHEDERAETKSFNLFRGPSTSSEFDTRLSTTSEWPLSLVHVLLTCALRIDCDLLCSWRTKMTAWMQEGATKRGTVMLDAMGEESKGSSAARENELRVPGQWRRSTRALRLADGEEPLVELDFLRDDDINRATASLLSRCLVCLCPLPDVDPKPALAIQQRGPHLCRFLSDRTAYKMLPATWGSDYTMTLQKEMDTWHMEDHSSPPHVLALVLMTNTYYQQRSDELEANEGAKAASLPPVSAKLWAQVMRHVDMQVFTASTPIEGHRPRGQLPQALFHPLLLPRFVLEVLAEHFPPAMLGPGPFRPLHQMITGLKHLASAKQKEAPSQAAPEGRLDIFCYPAEFMHSVADGLSEGYKQVAMALLRLHCSEWCMLPEEARKAYEALLATPLPSQGGEDEDPATLISRRLETAGTSAKVNDLERTFGQSLADCLAKVPSVGAPHVVKDVYAHAVLSFAMRRPKLGSLLGVLVAAAKDLALNPSRMETLAMAAVALKQVFFIEDDKAATEEDWGWRLQACLQHGSGADTRPPRVRHLCEQGRALNLMLRSRMENRLRQLLLSGAMAQGAESEAWSEGKQLAASWLARQLDLLALYRCKRHALPKGEDKKDPFFWKQLWLAQRCDAVARELLWFFSRCTDMRAKFRTTADVLEKHRSSWPTPSFAEAWEGAGLGDTPLMEFQAAGAGPPPYMWYIPYIVGRCQWFLVSHGITADTMTASQILALLKEAAELEHWARSVDKRPSDDRFANPDAKTMEVEPHWRLHLVRLKMLTMLPDGWKVANEHPWKSKHGSHEETRADCLWALRILADVDSRFQTSQALTLARQAEAAGRLAEAATEIEAAFTFPKGFPQNQGRAGMRVWRVEERHWPGTGENPDLWWQYGQRQRKYDSSRAKVLVFVLKLHRRILAEALPEGMAETLLRDGRSALPVPGTMPRLPAQPQETDAAAEAVQRLAEDRPRSWDALHHVTGLLVALARGMLPTPSNQFWVAFHAAFLRALRETFSALIRARPLDDVDGRPCLDWQLFAMLRSCCLGLEWTHANADELQSLSQCYAAAAAQLWAYATKQPAKGESSSVAKHTQPWHAADTVFLELVPLMPAAAGRWGSAAEVRSSVPRAASTAGHGSSSSVSAGNSKSELKAEIVSAALRRRGGVLVVLDDEEVPVL